MTTQFSPPHGRAAQENIEMVSRMEEEFLERRTASERVSDGVAGFAGSMTFVAFHLLGFLFWALVNTGRIPGFHTFDPYPFVLLALTVSCEGVILAAFVLMKQNRMMKRAEHRAHLDLQINLLAEREITKVLQMQREICKKLDCEVPTDDSELKELSQSTAVDHLAQEIHRQLPPN